ncbi:MAG: methyltransferase family protein [Rudaea sp.]
MSTPNSTHVETSVSAAVWLNRIVRLVGLIVVMDILLFIPAGRLDWPGAWILSILYFIFLLVMVVWSTLRAPELMEERSRTAPNVKRWDKVLLSLYTIALLALLIVAGLDAGRFRLSSMPPWLQVLGVVISILCGAWLLWVTKTNAFLSRHARIQDDRGQQVVTAGPYRYVRHPMYASLVPFIVSIALILGSWWAIVPGGIIIVLFFIRTALEDRMLQAELPGYKEYASRVRYRLLPGIW